MADTLDTNHGTDFRTPTNVLSARRRLRDWQAGTQFERALVPVAFVGLTLAFMAVGIVAVLTLTALLPSHPIVGLLGALALLAIAAAGPNIAGATLRGLVGGGERDA